MRTPGRPIHDGGAGRARRGGFRRGPAAHDAARNFAASLLRDRIDLVCPRNHDLTRRKQVTWKQALRFPFVSLTRDFTARLQADLFAASTALALEPAHEVAYATTALGMVKSGQGITALPTAAHPLVASFGLVAMPLHEPVVHREVSIFTRRGESLSPAAESLRAFLVDCIASR
jgi:DNA-binding transcriptional LysR family regulator